MKNPKRIYGIGLMCLAMLSIPLVDGLAKHLSAGYSPLFISWLRYCIASLLILPIGVTLFGRQTLPDKNISLHVLRTVFLVSAMTLFFLAIAITPLATATGAYFVGPVIASILAVYVLGERMTKLRLLALVAGFLGALIVVRPSASVDPGVFLALGSGALFACYLVSTRTASQETSPIKTLVFQCLLGALLLLPLGLSTWSLPMWQDVPLFVVMGVLSVLAHLLSIAAFRYAEASTLSPLVYLELLSAAAIGYFFFAETPALHVWVGVSFIVVSGLILITDRGSA